MSPLLPVTLKRQTRTRYHGTFVLAALIIIMLLSACAGPATVTEPGSIAGAAGAVSPADPAPTSGAGTPAAVGVSFSQDVLPILQSRCVRCHGGEKTEKGMNLTSYDNLMAGSEKGAVVVAGNADNSPLIQLVLQGKMPKRSPRLLPEQIQIFVDWVNSGALNN